MIIYKTTNLINGKIYIGQDSRNNQKYIGSGLYMVRAIKKYGKDNFIKEILEKCPDKETLDISEMRWISAFNSCDPKVGYNISKGGGGCLGCKVSDETKKKLSATLKGRPKDVITRTKISEALTGRVLSQEHRDKVSLNHHDVSGDKNPMFGKTHTDEVKELCKQRMLGTKASAETKFKMSLKHRGAGNGKAKLTEEQVLKIREIYFTTSISQDKLGEQFNVEGPCIYKIVNYRTWKHL